MLAVSSGGHAGDDGGSAWPAAGNAEHVRAAAAIETRRAIKRLPAV